MAEGYESAVTAERYVEADIETVWDTWTQPERLAEWWWPMFDDARYEIDPQTEGLYRFVSASGGVGVVGQFSEVEPPHRLTFSWVWQGGFDELEPRIDLVELELESQDAFTLVRVSQTAPIAEQDAVLEGWEDMLTRLEEYFLDAAS